MALNNDLPIGWEERLVTLHIGKAVTLKTLGRLDLLMTKLFAMCDRQQDIDD